MTTKVEIKVCGITTMEDAAMAFSYGADALGFIFYEKSQRYVTPEAAFHIIESLPPAISKVGVFVNHDINVVRDIYHFCRLDLIQLHGDESPDYCLEIPQAILIKAVSPKSDSDLALTEGYAVKAFLVDARDSGLYGGTGKLSNWEIARKLSRRHPVILSGGLNAENILTAIEKVSPDGVDVNSGVEFSPGSKDPKKVRSIIDMVHVIEKRRPESIFTRR
ncbi:MAG TPA: phosphoribosylanthranilate isomerase [Syntrophales bacterium]|nr:phosphoribosylanthranilate isomerase [Syntrophales bacterium]